MLLPKFEICFFQGRYITEHEKNFIESIHQSLKQWIISTEEYEYYKKIQVFLIILKLCIRSHLIAVDSCLSQMIWESTLPLSLRLAIQRHMLAILNMLEYISIRFHSIHNQFLRELDLYSLFFVFLSFVICVYSYDNESIQFYR